ncbi:hypothetical protein [Cohnella nanjingensis]|uniref:Uncharacterized protein n=1 Tax=Cohnella nanjingensis TaxID=1387779 RepID=A0A7X0RQ29_9BACL|nr:hypothetical protein [Cohnella nanjingensis]MBB6671552.1 hypothetical protein [Cohnella nanjingensis]
MTAAEAIPCLLSVCAIVTVIHWLKLRKHAPRKERIAYLSLIGAVWVLAILLLWIPHLPGPTQLVKIVFGPLGHALLDEGG